MRFPVILFLSVIIGCSDYDKEKTYYPDGSLKEIRSYRQGLRHGESILFLENGDTSKVFHYNEDSLKSMRLLVNNNTFIYQEFKDSAVKHGREIFYHPNGQIETIAEFKDGLPHGATLGYFKDGNLASKQYYDGGKDVGEFVQYYPNGKPFVSSKDVTTNIYTYHDSTGAKRFDLLMVNGKSTDTLKVY